MGAWVQDAVNIDDTGADVSSLAAAFAGNVVAGNLIYVWFGWGTNDQIPTVADTLGNTYTLIRKTFSGAPDNQGHASWFAANIAGGANTVTVSIGTASPDVRMGIMEISGLATSAPQDQETGQVQSAAGTGVDAVSSGNMAATTNASDFLVASTQDISELQPGAGTVTAGTNYTDRAKTGTSMGEMETRQVSATGVYAGTFTRSVSVDAITHVVAFKDAATTGWQALLSSRRNRLIQAY